MSASEQLYVVRGLIRDTGHEAKLTTMLEQSTDSTKVTWMLEGVPLGMEEETSRNLQGY